MVSGRFEERFAFVGKARRGGVEPQRAAHAVRAGAEELRAAKQFGALQVPQQGRQVTQRRDGERRPILHHRDEGIGRGPDRLEKTVLIQAAQAEGADRQASPISPGDGREQILIGGFLDRQHRQRGGIQQREGILQIRVIILRPAGGNRERRQRFGPQPGPDEPHAESKSASKVPQR